MCVGFVAAILIAGWVGRHWHDARPGVVFFLLRWVVSALAGMAISTLFHWWGEMVAVAAHDGPFGWLDRLVGGAIGLATAAGIAALFVLLLIQFPALGSAHAAALRSTSARPLVRAAARLTSSRGHALPGMRWLHGQFVSAEHRLGRVRSS